MTLEQPPPPPIAEAAKSACAACKKQRKKCDKNCKLAKLFTAEQAEDFDAVHRVFGIKNLMAILRKVEGEEMKRVARDTIVWEARQRVCNPLYGSFGLICQLQAQLVRLSEENDMLQKQIQQMQVIYWRGQAGFNCG